jgi:molybdopterin molybdotransferase
VTVPLAASDAARLILQHVRRQPALRVPLDDALDAVLAEPITSPIDIPAWRNAAMDGYAVRAADVRGASPAEPKLLRVVETVPAGRFPSRNIEPGTSARVFTGAPVPEGADSVVRQEDTDRGVESVAILADRDAGVNVRPAGEDIRRGTLVLEAGTELGPAALGVLASLAVANPMIYRRPRVGILGGGDEIADVDQPDLILSGRKIGSSNTHSLAALVRRAGGEPVPFGIARDTPESIQEHLSRRGECDLLMTTGGISVGEHDHLRAVMAGLGAELKFWRIRMRPGAPVGFGVLGELPWLGLPGNPVSTMVTFELFARPAIRKLAGRARCFQQSVRARLAEGVRVTPNLQHFLRATLTGPPDAALARLTGPQGSGILTSMLRADALLVIPEGNTDIPAGTEVGAIRLDRSDYQEEPGF